MDRRQPQDGVDVARRAKDLIDEGRADYLRANGFSASLRTYVDSSVSPENVIIVATPEADAGALQQSAGLRDAERPETAQTGACGDVEP